MGCRLLTPGIRAVLPGRRVATRSSLANPRTEPLRTLLRLEGEQLRCSEVFPALITSRFRGGGGSRWPGRPRRRGPGGAHIRMRGTSAAQHGLTERPHDIQLDTVEVGVRHHRPACQTKCRRSSRGRARPAGATQGAFGIHSAPSMPRFPERMVENGSILCHGGGVTPSTARSEDTTSSSPRR